MEGPAAVGGGRWHGREVGALGLQVDCERVLELEGPEFKSQPRFPFLSPDFLSRQTGIISLSYGTANVIGSVS